MLPAGRVRLVVLVLALFAAGPAAAEEDVFTVTGIEVDERAGDELSAKAAGIAGAKRRGLRMLLQRLTLQSDHARLPQPGDSTTETLLQEFSVDQEKFGGGRYLASISVRFKPAEIRRLLEEAGIPYTATASQPFLVLPVYVENGRPVLWDAPNPWFDAWSRQPPPGGLVSFVVPLGDLADVSAINAQEALAKAGDRLAEIAARYGTANVLIAEAVRVPSSGGTGAGLRVSGQTYGFKLDVPAVVDTLPAESEGQSEAYAAAALALAERLGDEWRRQNLVRPGQVADLEVVVPLSGLQEWLAVRHRLESVAVVRRVDVARLSRTEAVVRIVYNGDPRQLELALAQRDLQLSYAPAQFGWVLRPTGDRR